MLRDAGLRSPGPAAMCAPVSDIWVRARLAAVLERNRLRDTVMDGWAPAPKLVYACRWRGGMHMHRHSGRHACTGIHVVTLLCCACLDGTWSGWHMNGLAGGCSGASHGPR